jgi:hypothetical protein
MNAGRDRYHPGCYHSTGSAVRPPVSAVGASWQLLGRDGEPQCREAGGQLGEDLLELDAGERGADAVVGTVPEREVAGPVAGDVEATGAGEDRGIVVGGAVFEQHQLAGIHGDLPDTQACPTVAEDGNAAAARRAQDLLDRGGHLVWVRRQRPLLGRIGQQAQDTHIDGHHRRLMAREQQVHRERRDLAVVETSGAQPGDDVVPWLRALADWQAAGCS